MADEGNAERLVVMLEARIRDFERNMARASGTATRNHGQMRRSSMSATRQMEADMVRSTTRINTALASTTARVGTFTRSFMAMSGVVVPILSVAGALNTARTAMTEFDRIGKQAKSGGLDSEFFQELAYAAQLGGVEVNQLSSALDTLNRNSGQAAVGKGQMVTTLKELNPQLLEAIQNARSQEERLRLVADALDEEADASRRAAIATAAFGGAGAQMVEVLRGGSDALDQTAAKARELGIVIDRELIAKGEELNDEFSTATEVMNRQFQKALIDIAPFLVQAAQWAGNLASAISDISDAIKYLRGDFEGMSTRNLQGTFANDGADRLRIENEILQIESRMRQIPENAFNADTIRAPMEAAIAGLNRELAEIAEREEQINAILSERVAQGAAFQPPELLEDTDEIETRNRKADATIRQAEAVKGLIADLEHELSLVGLSKADQEQLNVLRRAGAAATEEQKDRLVDLVQSLADATEVAQIQLENQTPWDILRDRLEELDGMLDRGALGWEQYGQAASMAMASATSATLGAIGQQTSMLAKAFEDNKALSIANAIVSGGEAVANSYAAGTKIGGPAVGAIFAATAGAASVAQVAAIASTNKNSKSLGSSGGSGGAATAAPQQQAIPRHVTANFTFAGNGRYSRDEIRDQIDQFTKFINDGGGVDFRYAIKNG